MDVGTLLGIVLGFLLISVSILMGGSLMLFIHVPSLMITIGGTIAATLINYPLNRVIGVFRICKKVILQDQGVPQDAIASVIRLSAIARKEGLLALENEIQKLNDPFLAKGLQLIIDGFPPESVRGLMEIELQSLQERHSQGRKIMEAIGNYAPAFGMIGTLIGLVTMLRSLDDPSSIGGGMATALVTTFYGAVCANLIFLPLAGKLEARSKEELLMRQILMEGILSIQAGEIPQFVTEKLNAFVEPALRTAART